MPTHADLSPAPSFVRTSDLNAQGWSWRAIRGAVEHGALYRLRQGAFCEPETDAGCRAAGALRGRLTCVSELHRRGIFVRDRTAWHVHVPEAAARLPATAEVRVHRRRLERQPHPRALSVELFDALLHSVLCQEPRAALATLDSALHHGALREDEVGELFAALPRRYRRLQGLLDARAESGPETLVRLMLRSVGCPFDVQVRIDGVGRVDFLVAGWLIVECDSQQFHSDWKAQLNDRRRDLAAAERGYAVLRLAAEDIMWRPDDVLRALRCLAARPRRVAKAG